MSTESPSTLAHEVFVSDGPTRAGEERLPDGSPSVWSPLSSTLIYGERDAVLVDPPFTKAQVAEVGDWIERSGKRLAVVFATHGHGDHWFGTGELAKRFSGVKVYATEGAIDAMHRQATIGRAQLWDRIFPNLLPDTPVLATPIPAEGFLLEGNRIVAIETGHTDTDRTSVLHVPAIGLVVAGDVAYNGVHLYISEGGNGGLQQWLQALDLVDELRPRAVVAGHKNRDLPDDPVIVDQTRKYLIDVIRILEEKPTPEAFFEQMTTLHPDRLNPGPVWWGAQGLLPG
jgi:glyoxylase-like metal-dependent hydrolase (beta-lactamase superfamily II)